MPLAFSVTRFTYSPNQPKNIGFNFQKKACMQILESRMCHLFFVMTNSIMRVRWYLFTACQPQLPIPITKFSHSPKYKTMMIYFKHISTDQGNSFVDNVRYCQTVTKGKCRLRLILWQQEAAEVSLSCLHIRRDSPVVLLKIVR